MTEKRRVFVCGASGFLGRNIFERLSKREDLDVRGSYHTKREFYHFTKLDFANYILSEHCARDTHGVDTVIQCAALTAGSGRKCDWPFFASHNIRINQNLIEAAVANDVKHFIFLSCSVMYPVNLGHAIKEEEVDRNNFHPDYEIGALAKLLVEDLCRINSANTNFIVIRHSNIYGPYDKFDLKNSHVTAATIQKTMTATSNMIYMRGGMDTSRDLLYVSDLVDFVEDFVVFGPREKFLIFNVGAGKSISIGELAHTVVKVSGRDLMVVFESEKNLASTSIVLDIKKARISLGWKPVVSLEEGIKKTIDWWRAERAENHAERGGKESR